MASTRVTPNSAPATPDLPSKKGTEFVFLVCQHGTEPVLKSRYFTPESPLRLAFSRPGLLTFKVQGAEANGGSESRNHPSQVGPPADWLIRQSGWALGQLRGSDAKQLATETLQLAGTDWNHVHVFARDSALVGQKGFEPGATEVTKAVEDVLRGVLPTGIPVGGIAKHHDRILDVILIEPDQWLIGWHAASEPQHTWPGGALPLNPPTEIVSRAYLKMAEAIAWSGLPPEAGQKIVEIGSAPGGSCQRLLDLGLEVTGVDPAEMDPMIASHPRFTHWRSKAAGVKRKLYSPFRWLAADANVAPNYTLEVIEDIVQYPTSRFEGLLLTLKLSSYDLVEQMDGFVERVRSWGFPEVKVRQLASNRRECTVYAARGQDWVRPDKARPSKRRPQKPSKQDG